LIGFTTNQETKFGPPLSTLLAASNAVVYRRTEAQSGEKLQVISFDERIELVRTRPMRQKRGFLKGLDPTFQREEDDRA
jgi:hypothetical protein